MQRAAVVEQQIAGLDIAMNYSLGMGVVQGPGNVTHHGNHLPNVRGIGND